MTVRLVFALVLKVRIGFVTSCMGFMLMVQAYIVDIDTLLCE